VIALALALVFEVTAYAPGCGATGLTKAGTVPVEHHCVAADPAVLPIGTLVRVEGLSGLRQVHDTGRLIKGRALDLYVGSCAEAIAWGRRRRRVDILHVPQERRGTRASQGRPR
jgi:resuscitation-promoting factor RpfB